MIAPAAVITITIPWTISQCSGLAAALRSLRCRLAGVVKRAKHQATGHDHDLRADKHHQPGERLA